MGKPLDVQEVHTKMERAANETNIDRRDLFSRDAFKQANKLSDSQQDRLTKKLVTDGLLPKVIIDNGLVKDGKNLTADRLKEMSEDKSRTKLERKLLKELSTSPEGIKRAREILNGQRENPEYRKKVHNAAETANAMRHMPKLMERNKKLGGSGKDGLTKEDINKLLKQKDLSKGERRALEFMKKNYGDLSTKRDSKGEGWRPWNDRRVTPESLRRNAKDEFGITDKRIDTARKSQIRDSVEKTGKVEIRKGEGYWHAAKRRLSEGDKKPSNSEIAKEMMRLKKLNKGRGLLHPGDKVKAMTDEDARKEVEKRMRATA